MRPIAYDDFRTGLTYREVYHMIYGRKWKRRNGVLGFWRELKRAMYREYLHDIGIDA
jgi:phage FluMu gp28-like protein